MQEHPRGPLPHEPPSPDLWHRWTPWLLAGLITALAGLPSLVYPHGRDQGSYAYAGWRLLEGELPYRDVIAFKPPGSVLVHALSVALFGVNEVAIRALDLGWAALTALALVGLGRQLGASAWGAGLAGAAWGLLYWQVDYWNVAQTDGWVNLPVALTLWATLAAFRAPPRRAALLWAGGGALLGGAVLLKYTALGAAVPVAIAVAVGGQGQGWRAARAFAWGGLGLLAVLGLALAALVGTGSWAAFAEIQFELIPDYVARQRRGESGLWGSVVRAASLRPTQADIVPLAVAGPTGLLLAWRGLPWRGLGVVLAWWAMAAAGLLAQGKYFDYHYLPLLGPAALLAGAGVDGLVGLLPQRSRPVAWGLGAVALLGALWASPLATYAQEAARIAGGEDKIGVWAQVRRYNYRDYDAAEIDAAGAWLAEHTEPDQGVFVWSYDPAILVRARRRQVSRFLYNFPFRVAWANPAWETELLEALDQDPPAALVIATKDATPGVLGHSRDSTADLARSPAIKARLERDWCEVGRRGRYRLWLPRASGC